MKTAFCLVTTCLSLTLFQPTGLAEELAFSTPVATEESLSEIPPEATVFETSDVFRRIDTRVIIPQLSLALFHLCSLADEDHNPCGHYILRGPWHEGISWGPIHNLFQLPKQQQDFAWRWYGDELLEPPWLKSTRKL